MTLEDVRRLAFGLPEVSEEPHFHFISFRVRGKIFATLPPDTRHLHVFVDEPTRETMLTIAPHTYEKLLWGEKVVGLRVKLATAQRDDVDALLRCSWRRKAPRELHENGEAR